MTLDELRDWHDNRIGLKWVDEGDGHGEWHDADGNVCWPFPPTLDGAASAMPEGWKLRRLGWTDNGWEACAMLNAGHIVSVCDQPTEIHARYLLAKLAHEAEKEKA